VRAALARSVLLCGACVAALFNAGILIRHFG